MSDGGDKPDFWTRRRAAVREARARETVTEKRRADTERAAALAEKTDAEILAELGLPDPDQMSAGEDFKPFLRTVVPERLRRRALRRLWGLNPVLANLDGLIEYGEDFTDAATVIDDLQTTYQVGKGMLEHLKHLAEQEARESGGGTDTDPVPDDENAQEAVAGTSPTVEPTELSEEHPADLPDPTGRKPALAPPEAGIAALTGSVPGAQTVGVAVAGGPNPSPSGVLPAQPGEASASDLAGPASRRRRMRFS